MSLKNPYENIAKNFELNGKTYKYYSLQDLNDNRLYELPFCIRVLLESVVRNADEYVVKSDDVEKVLNWRESSQNQKEVPFKPARVLMQDFTGVPGIVDLAALRDAVKRLGGEPSQVNPLVPVDLVVDHSVQVDSFRRKDAIKINEEREFERNYERFKFLKWGSKAFKNLTIVPPGSGIVHQVNLEYLARVVFEGELNESNEIMTYPDSLVGTDSHTTMINGLGVLGWGVGGIEAEASMLGQPISLVLPKVVGYKLTGKLKPPATSTDLVLTITQNLRQLGVVGKFVEFYGPGVAELSIADRATISNMSPEYGATMGYFPIDHKTLEYLKQTNRSSEKIQLVEKYLRAQKIFNDYQQDDPKYSEVIELDLSTVVPSLAGPKRPHDRVSLNEVHKEFQEGLTAKRGFKGFEIPENEKDKQVQVQYTDENNEQKTYTLEHGSVVIAAITSCTNTSNPSVMLAAGLVAKKALENGLDVAHYIKTSLAPGSGVVTEYLKNSGLLDCLDQLGFNIVGYGCTTCIGNSGELPEPIQNAIQENNLVCSSVLSGNRNFEARVHPLVQANYLASPPLVVAYALAGNFKKDLQNDPIGYSSKTGQPVYLKDLWPTNEEIHEYEKKYIQPEMFQDVYNRIKQGTETWNKMEAPDDVLYPWDPNSTYIHDPPFFKHVQHNLDPIERIQDAYCLLNLGDSVTTDHVSPAGGISMKSPAARYLMDKGVKRKDFNTYGARRGNDEVMARGTFANVRIYNKMIGKPGPMAVHVPTDEVASVFDTAMKYREQGHPLVVLAGEQYGTGSSRDWAAKGPYLLGVRAVIATSYERIHRSNLVGMGIIPLQFKPGENADQLGLTGREQFSIDLSHVEIQPGMDVEVGVKGHDKIQSITTTLRFDTDVEVEYFKHGGILQYVLRTRLAK